MESVLGANCRIPLIHMSKRKFYIEETKERINEFSFAYMFNPTLHTKKVFKEQVKACLGNTFGTDTNKHINNILLRRNTRVIALIIHYEHGTLKTRFFLKVLSCVVYTIIDRYVCIDYFLYIKKKKSEIKLGLSLKTKHEGMDYDNLLVLVYLKLSLICCHVRQ